ncbi:MAG: hypothetical protein OEV19_00745 [Candidatus Bathyarchaeota archaeon]|nr:hypothetical protein [Candidatus Bathyarchaeota archaeon]MDH5635803.1 hypothetical protein [Candidatus Bathyarchaeota archaeon]MDH5701747.1 hypothetical protein [Candidatus Bathyarchaeota archaeon]
MLLSSLIDFMDRKWWLQISGQTDFLFNIILFIIDLIVMTIVFYVAGVIVVGKRRALFSDAFVISLLGTVVSNICSLFFPPVIGLILSLIVWLLLIRRYYETGWLGALAVAILAVIIYVMVWVILAFLFAIPPLLFAGLLSI